MPVIHTFRGPDGDQTKSLTGMTAIRANCLECVGWNNLEVKQCTSKKCPLYPFRFGNMGGKPNGNGSKGGKA